MFAIGSRDRRVCMVEFGEQASMSAFTSEMLPDPDSPGFLSVFRPAIESFKAFPGSYVGVILSFGIALRSSNVSFCGTT
jgi:hypothetical protein